MRLTSHVITALVALVALAWSSSAAAEADIPNSTLEPSVLWALADLDLDAAFERATWPISDDAMQGLSGPTTMDCKNCEDVDIIEICEVRAEGKPVSKPASLAQH